jgi:hypothetical protein
VLLKPVAQTVGVRIEVPDEHKTRRFAVQDLDLEVRPLALQDRQDAPDITGPCIRQSLVAAVRRPAVALGHLEISGDRIVQHDQ